MAVSEIFLDQLKRIVGPKGWTTDAAGLEPHIIETRGLWRGNCDIVIRPASTDEVAKVMTLCHEAGVAVVPQGGNTGLTGAGVPQGGVVLSLSRMNKILDVDPVNYTMTVQAGCVLAAVQETAKEQGRLFPLNLGAQGSCQIGGNLSTNAGGVQVLRYGNARDLVLGLEVVLADGQVWNGLKALRKDNTGYALKHLFIGAEGTLGVITAAVLKLFPWPERRETAFVALPDGKSALQLFQKFSENCGDALTAFEYLNAESVKIAIEHGGGVKPPFTEKYNAYTLIELSGAGAALRDALEGVLEGALEDGIAIDAIIAESGRQADDLWRIREAVPEVQPTCGASIKHDISVPVSKVPEFLELAQTAVEAEMAGIRTVAFGHLGDGNIHFNLGQPPDMDADAFLDQWDHFNRIVHDIVNGLGGSFSAEHGIGQLKVDEMKRYKGSPELELMKALKDAFDPKGIMNPGKVL